MCFMRRRNYLILTFVFVVGAIIVGSYYSSDYGLNEILIEALRQNTTRKNGVFKGVGIEELDIGKRFEMRKLHAEQTCLRTKLPVQKQCQMNGVKHHLHVVGSYNMTFCAIEKAGSTFWKRILKVYDSSPDGSKGTNPFDYSKGRVFSTQKTLKNDTSDAVLRRMGETKNIVFVRDPYTRVFSGYLDKLYNVNTYYWFGFGKKIVQTERTRPSNTSLECGHDVTFPEFISSLVRKLKREPCLDPHFSSSYAHCFPCNFTYTYIGKYETLREDVVHILSAESMLQNINLTNLEESNDIDSIIDGSKFAFGNMRKVEKCMPFVSGLRRFWRRLQCRGMLDKRAKFPYTNASGTNLTEARFRETLIKAYREFDPKDRLLNRLEALSEAYRSLSESLTRDFYEVLKLDFEIFGYSSNPPVTDVPDYKYLVYD